MEMAMSHRSFAVISPASNAFWCPRLRERSAPQNRGHPPCSRVMSSHVRSLEPSLTNSTRLRSEILPAAISPSSLARSRREVSGSTSSSL